jgi:ribonuclease HI
MAQKKSKAVDYPEEDTLNIYTDGSMLPGPRRGGTGVIFILINDDGDEEEDVPYLPGTGATNNQMEIRAPLEALKLALGRHPPFDPGRYRKIIVFTDSQYVYNNYGTAMYTWSAKRVEEEGRVTRRQCRRLEGTRRPDPKSRPGRQAIRHALGAGQEDGPREGRRQARQALRRHRPCPVAAAGDRQTQTLEAGTRSGLGSDARPALDDPNHQV